MFTHYDTLGISQNAGKEEIRTAYRKLARQHHPDRNPGNDGAEDKFKKATAAYEVLSDDGKKAIYDLSLRPDNSFRGNPFNMGVIDDFIEEVVRQGLDPSVFRRSRYGRRAGPVPSAAPRETYRREVQRPEEDGEDIEVELTITLEEAVGGCVKGVQSKTRTKVSCYICSGNGCRPGTRSAPCSSCGGRGYRPNFSMTASIHDTECLVCNGKGHVPLKACPKCDGTGGLRTDREVKVRIPVGIDEGQKLRLAGQGEPGVGRPPGDLFVTVKVAPHDVFLRKGEDLYAEHAVSLDVALNGGVIQVPTLGGPPLTVDVPLGMEPGRTVIPVRGAGIPSRMRRDRGDLYVTLQVSLPKIKTPRAAQLLHELLHELGKGK